MKGLVIKNTGSWYSVLTDDGVVVESKIKGNFRLKGIRSTNPVAVGDRVCIVVNAEGTAFITEIEDRRNYIIRKSSNLSKQSQILGANIDQAMLFVTVARPETLLTFVDRFLASAEAYSVDVIIALSKADSYDAAERSEMERIAALYGAIGYRVVSFSALTPPAAELRAMLRGQITLIAGNSGTGKSTFVNSLIPGADARTAAISESHLTGTHTTTDSRMYFLPEGGAVIDIPGIKGFGTFDMKKEEISHYFREIFERGRECRFSNCLHTDEPGCAVKEAVERGEIAASRYASYINMLDDVDEAKYRQAF